MDPETIEKSLDVFAENIGLNKLEGFNNPVMQMLKHLPHENVIHSVVGGPNVPIYGQFFTLNEEKKEVKVELTRQYGDGCAALIGELVVTFADPRTSKTRRRHPLGGNTMDELFDSTATHKESPYHAIYCFFQRLQSSGKCAVTRLHYHDFVMSGDFSYGDTHITYASHHARG